MKSVEPNLNPALIKVFRLQSVVFIFLVVAIDFSQALETIGAVVRAIITRVEKCNEKLFVVLV